MRRAGWPRRCARRRRNRCGARTQISTGNFGAQPIAEGADRPTPADRRRYFGMAIASLRETQHHLRQCREYELLDEHDYMRLAGLSAVTRRMLERLSDSRR